MTRLRSEFQLDGDVRVPEDCPDSVGWFLDARTGPDYLFATTAAVMLRSLGYPTRLTTGFYARPERFDRRAGQTAVLAEDVHVWVEVCIDGRTWIPIEPTPGYAPPRERLTWRQWAAAVARDAARWAGRHAIALSMLLVATVIGWFQRLAVFDTLAYAAWRLAAGTGGERRVRWTIRIAVGVVVAGILDRLVGRAGTRRLFGQQTRRALLQAWLVGMLLPVCSLGVIPVLRQLHRAGVSGGTILAFGLTAPLFNPISVLYGLTLSEPIAIITFCFCSLVIVTAVGMTWDHLFPDAATGEPEPPPVAYGIQRMLAVAVTAARELAGPATKYILVGLAGVALLSVVLPFGSLQQAAEHHDSWAPLFMAAVAVPAYATPMTAMVPAIALRVDGGILVAAKQPQGIVPVVEHLNQLDPVVAEPIQFLFVILILGASIVRVVW